MDRLLLRADELLRSGVENPAGGGADLKKDDSANGDPGKDAPMPRVAMSALMLDAVFASKVQNLQQRCDAMREEATLEVSSLQVNLTQLLWTMGPNEEVSSVLGGAYSHTAIPHLLPLMIPFLEDLLKDE
ncbi:unnamed protein product [Phytomonas sp. Hart1]|nr:unnamed protein product [Phytomonas sp. Hart1]|eukprot:CCW71691.1 unnamed protein product [Phytomonas sp. isolate Hart1]